MYGPKRTSWLIVAIAVGAAVTMAVASMFSAFVPLLLIIWAIAAVVQLWPGLRLPMGWLLLPGALLQLVGAVAGLQIAFGASFLLPRIDPFPFYNLISWGLPMSLVAFGIITFRSFRRAER